MCTLPDIHAEHGGIQSGAELPYHLLPRFEVIAPSRIRPARAHIMYKGSIRGDIPVEDVVIVILVDRNGLTGGGHDGGPEFARALISDGAPHQHGCSVVVLLRNRLNARPRNEAGCDIHPLNITGHPRSEEHTSELHHVATS